MKTREGWGGGGNNIKSDNNKICFKIKEPDYQVN